MTEAGWTRDRPQVAGWYWWRSLNGMIGPEIIQIDNTNGPDTDLEVIGPFGETPLDEWIAESEDEPGEWQGPLSPDSYQQGRVAGLREAVPLACKYCNDRTKWTPMSNSGYHVCNMPEPGFVRCQAIKIHAALAQQAQKEKGVGDGK